MSKGLIRDDLDRVTAELAAELPNVQPQEINRCVREASEEFGNASITQFLPILVRRAARERLGAKSRA